MFCYRRFGHNEGDDPTMTQPVMYAKIKGHPSTRELYGQRLAAEGVVTQAEIDAWVSEAEEPSSTVKFEAGKTYHADKADWLDGKWAQMPHRQRRRPPRPDRGSVGAPEGHRPQDHRDPFAHRRAPDRQARDRPSSRGDRVRRRPRLGHGRALGLRRRPRSKAFPGNPASPDRTVCARHLRAASLRHHRSDDGRTLHAAQQHPVLARRRSKSIDSARCPGRRRCSAFE